MGERGSGAQGFLGAATSVREHFATRDREEDVESLDIRVDTGEVAEQVEQASLGNDLLGNDLLSKGDLNVTIQAVASHLNEKAEPPCNLPGDLNCDNITREILTQIEGCCNSLPPLSGLLTGFTSGRRLGGIRSDVDTLIQQWDRDDSRLGEKRVIGGIVFRRPELEKIDEVLSGCNPQNDRVKKKLILQTIVLLKHKNPTSFISDPQQYRAIYQPVLDTNCTDFNSAGRVKGFLRSISGKPGYRTGDMTRDAAKSVAGGAVGAASHLGQRITGNPDYKYQMLDGSRALASGAVSAASNLGKTVSGMFKGPSGGAAGPDEGTPPISAAIPKAAGPSGGAAGPNEGIPPISAANPEGVPGSQPAAQPAAQPPAQTTPRWAQRAARPDPLTTATTAAPTDSRVAAWLDPDDVAAQRRRAPQAAQIRRAPQPGLQSVSQPTDEQRLNQAQDQLRDLQAQAQEISRQLKRSQGGRGVRRTTRRTKRRKTKRYRKNTRRRTYKKRSRKKRRTRRR